MLLGDTCTRGCKFCSIKTSIKGQEIDLKEPEKLASAIKEMELDYAVLTVVDRDDLYDGGANHIAKAITEIKSNSDTKVEILSGDFQGRIDQLKIVIDSNPDVFAHNVETVERLQKKVRDLRANYRQSLQVLENAKELNPNIITKTSLMLGLGETNMEVFQTMVDMRKAGVDILTLGQYMQPKNKVLPIHNYVTPQEFESYKKMGERIGFKFVASGPFVRSSYKAGELFIKNILDKKYSN
jgi:lipoic acid synthetase